ncbi:hypothetical protein GCM10010222_12240 [Streptomyces tanashiensis]|nr:hypothetical protein GCM10010222_12240 [Streptomyces tanashiensis]
MGDESDPNTAKERAARTLASEGTVGSAAQAERSSTERSTPHSASVEVAVIRSHTWTPPSRAMQRSSTTPLLAMPIQIGQRRSGISAVVDLYGAVAGSKAQVSAPQRPI